MSKEKWCPIAFPKLQNCLRDECAWWHTGHLCCSAKAIVSSLDEIGGQLDGGIRIFQLEFDTIDVRVGK